MAGGAGETAGGRGDGNGSAAGSPTVASIMRRDFVTIPSRATLLEARQLMRVARLRHLLVEREGILVGLVSYRGLLDDALDRLAGRAPPLDLDALPVESAMVAPPYVASPDDRLADAALRLCRLGLGCLPVAELSERGPTLLGVLTETDLILAAYGSP